MRKTRQILAVAAASLFGLTAQLGAQQIDFHGFALGCFYTGAGPCSSAFASTDPSPVPPGASFLLYTSDGFTGTTNNGSPNKVSFGGGCPPVGACGGFGNITVNA